MRNMQAFFAAGGGDGFAAVRKSHVRGDVLAVLEKEVRHLG